MCLLLLDLFRLFALLGGFVYLFCLLFELLTLVDWICFFWVVWEFVVLCGFLCLRWFVDLIGFIWILLYIFMVVYFVLLSCLSRTLFGVIYFTFVVTLLYSFVSWFGLCGECCFLLWVLFLITYYFVYCLCCFGGFPCLLTDFDLQLFRVL